MIDQSSKLELVCSEVAHVFDDHAEPPPLSYSERRKMREALRDSEGINRYGGRRCRCSECGDIHWTKRVTNPKVESESK